MNIPERLKVGGLDYEVSFVENLARDYGANGSHWGNALKIKIDDSLPRQNQETTFLHEIIEALNFVYEIKLEHKQLSVLEAGLYQVLKDNGMLVE